MRLGDLSARYESNRDPGAISSGDGDAGDVLYGCYQLSTNMGSVKAFVDWLKEQGSPFANILGQHPPGLLTFSAAWKYCAENASEEFEQRQYDYIRHAYYEPAVEALREEGYNIESHSDAMQEVIWSRSVQYGPDNIAVMFEDAVKSLGYDNLSYVDSINFDADMVKAVYLNVCKSEAWTSGNPDLRRGLYNRFKNECDDVLAMLA